MKKIFTLLLAVVSVALFALSVSAYGVSRLNDNADIISDENEQIILNYLDEKSNEQDFTFAVLTENTIRGGDVQDYADEYYDANYGRDTDGIILLIVMDTREWAFSTSGLGKSYFGDSELYALEDTMVSELSDGNYAQGIYNYAQTALYYVDFAKTYGYNFTDDGYDVDHDYYGDYEPHRDNLPTPLSERLTVSGIIGAIVSLISTSAMRSKMNTVHKKQSASDYIRKDSLNITRANDYFLTSSIARTLRAQSNSGSSHHGGGGGVHISSGGGSHGGSHGHF